MKLLRNICRILTGLLFIYSGFVKGIDPLGSNYKFIDYFTAFHMSWMEPAALVLAFLLALVEFVMGLCLFLNIHTPKAAWSAFVFMVAFTPLTLILAVKNPVTDCGCFGDAVVLSNWNTFWKNMVLLSMTLVVCFNRQKFKSVFNFTEQTVILLTSSVFMLILELHCYHHLPLLDFRPYAIGKNISDGMTVPEGAPQDEYDITLTYRNRQSGEIREFTEQNYPQEDTLHWEYAGISTKLVKEGFKPPIHDFTIQHPGRGDITEEILHEPGYTFLAIAYDLNATDPTNQDRLNRLAEYAREAGIRFYGLTASPDNEIRAYSEKHGVGYDFCSADEIQLKTMIRSNPGLILLREGTILDKWSHRDFPEAGEFKDRNLTAYCLEKQRTAANKYWIWTLAMTCTGFCFSILYRRHSK